MKCLIVEDDVMSRASLVRLCKKISGMEVEESGDALEAMEMLKSQEFDLVFLDVEMPDMSGMDLLKTLPEMPPTIITSGNRKYAFDAFEFNVVDYIEKPVSLQRLIKGLNKIEKRDTGKSIREAEDDALFVKVDGKLVRLNLPEIQSVESLRDYVIFRTVDDRYIVYSSLKNIEEKLKNDNRFLKVHRSYIINMNWIKDVDDKSVVIGDRVVPVSRSHRTSLVEKLNML